MTSILFINRVVPVRACGTRDFHLAYQIQFTSLLTPPGHISIIQTLLYQ